MCCDIKTAERRIVGYQEPYNRMTAVTGLRWEGTTAKWNGRENFSGAYRIDLYTVTGEGTDAVYTHFKTFALSGNYTSANFANAFAAGKKYAFTVTAIGDQSLLEELGLTDSITSAYSDVYDPNKDKEDPSTKEWVDISSAAQWIALANVEDEPTEGTDSPNRQQVGQELPPDGGYRLLQADGGGADQNQVHRQDHLSLYGRVRRTGTYDHRADPQQQ